MTNYVTEPVRDDEGIIHELWDYELRTVESFDTSAAAANTYQPAMIAVGKKTIGALSQAKVDVVGANKGAITLTDTTNAVADVYTLVAVAANLFEVINSEGAIVGELVPGVAFAGPTGTITKAVGSADAAGDKATVTVSMAAAAGTVVPLNANPAAADGSGVPYGVAPRRVRQSATVVKAPVIVGPAVLRDNPGFYPAGTNAGQQAAIRAALAAKHIIVKPAQNVA